MAKKTKKPAQTNEPQIDKRVELLMGKTSESAIPLEFTAGDETIVVNVKTNIPLYERSQMVEEIADFHFVEDMYVPYMKQFARRVAVLSHYTDLAIGELDAITAHQLTRNDDLYWAVYKAIEDDVDDIFLDANELVEWYKQKLLRSTKADELYDTVKGFMIGLESMLDGVAANTTATSLSDILAAVQHVAKKDETEIARGVLDFQQARAKTVKRKTPAAEINK